MEVFILLLVDLGWMTTLSESQGHHQLRAMNSLTDSYGDPQSEGTWNIQFTRRHTHIHTHRRLLITMTPATLPDAKPLCRGTVRSSPCCGSRAETALTHWGGLSRSWRKAGLPASKAQARASNSGVPPKLTFFPHRHISTDPGLPTRPCRRFSLSKTSKGQSETLPSSAQ